MKMIMKSGRLEFLTCKEEEEEEEKEEEEEEEEEKEKGDISLGRRQKRIGYAAESGVPGVSNWVWVWEGNDGQHQGCGGLTPSAPLHVPHPTSYRVVLVVDTPQSPAYQTDYSAWWGASEGIDRTSFCFSRCNPVSPTPSAGELAMGTMSSSLHQRVTCRHSAPCLQRAPHQASWQSWQSNIRRGFEM